MNEIIDAVKSPFDDTAPQPNAKTMALTWFVLGVIVARAL